MAAYFDADVVILHAPPYYPLESQLRSLSAHEPHSRHLGVRPRSGQSHLGPARKRRWRTAAEAVRRRSGALSSVVVAEVLHEVLGLLGAHFDLV